MSTALSINLNKIALLRNSRDTGYPDPVKFGQLCIDCGCHGITVHPRPDQRHIRPDDVARIAALVAKHPSIEYNIEGNPFAGPREGYPGFVELVMTHKPHQVTLVPDGDDQLTSDHGFNLNQSSEKLEPLVRRFKDAGIRVSLFMDPDCEQIRMVKELGADRIELYTGPYAESHQNAAPDFPELHKKFEQAAVFAQEAGIGVNAGHDLNLQNLPQFCQIPGILEVSIGHAFTVDSLLLGMETAMQDYLSAVE